MKKCQTFSLSVMFMRRMAAKIQEKKLSLSILLTFKILKRLISILKQCLKGSQMESFYVNLVGGYQQKSVTQRSTQRRTLKGWTSLASTVTNHSGQDIFLENIFVDIVWKSNFSGQEIFWGSIKQNHVMSSKWTFISGQGMFLEIILENFVSKNNFFRSRNTPNSSNFCNICNFRSRHVLRVHTNKYCKGQ